MKAHRTNQHRMTIFLILQDHDIVQTQEKRATVISAPRASPWNLPVLAQPKPEKKAMSNVDAVPNKKVTSTKSPSSDQASPSRDPKAYIPKTASPKPAAQPPTSLSRPLSAPIIPPKQASPLISAAQTSTTTPSLDRSMSSPTHSQTYIPQSYKHAIIGSSGFNQSTGTNTLPPYSHPSGFPINVGSWDVPSVGSLWTGASTSHRTTNPYNTSVTSTIRPTDIQITRTAQMTDEFPHLDIINDLLEDEQSSIDNNLYHAPSQFNNQYSYHTSPNLGFSGRSRSYSDDGFHNPYNDYMPYSSPYTNWQMANMELAMRNQDDASASATYSDLNMSGGINGYREFRPSNGH